MRISSRPLNKGETLCCSIRRAKDFFKDTDVELSLGDGCRDFAVLARADVWHYCDKTIKGRVVASMETCANLEDPYMRFYVLKETEYSEELRREFEEKHLPQYMRLYKEMLNLPETALNHRKLLTELYQGKLIAHEVKFN